MINLIFVIMKKNMGTLDKAIRIIVALVIVALYFANIINGITAIVAGVIAVIFFLTSVISFCPLYAPFGISTCKSKKQKA